MRRPSSRLEYFAGDDLALLGDADGALHGAPRLRQNCLIARPTAAADRAAATVKKTQADVVAPKDLDQLDLGLVELPPGGEKSAILVAVRVSEHDLLRLAAAAQQPHVIRQCEQRVHDCAGVAQIVDGLEQRHDVDVHLALARAQKSRFLQQQGYFENVGWIACLRDHVVGNRDRAVESMRVRGLAGDGEFGGGLVRIADDRARQEGAVSAVPPAARLRARPPAGSRVARARKRLFEEFVDHALVHVGVLPQVDAGKMESEYADGPANFAKPSTRE